MSRKDSITKYACDKEFQALKHCMKEAVSKIYSKSTFPNPPRVTKSTVPLKKKKPKVTAQWPTEKGRGYYMAARRYEISVRELKNI